MNILEPGPRDQAQATPNPDIAYYRKRAIQEQVAAQRARCPTAQSIHDELAALYRFRVSMLTDAASEMGMTIALQRLSQHMHASELPAVPNGSITAVAGARARNPAAQPADALRLAS